MAQEIKSSSIPIPEQLLRNASKNLPELIPNFQGKEAELGVKELHEVIGPILDTADSADLAPSHKAAACNALCAIIENCRTSDVDYVREALLDDFIWFRLFEIFLQRSDNAKGKSIRQVLLVLTGLLLKDDSARSLELRDRALKTFIDIICQRQDRLKVKPALQGLAHFIQKEVISIPELIQAHLSIVPQSLSENATRTKLLQGLFDAFLAWIVHHDTSLSAGHLIKNFLTQVRRSSNLVPEIENAVAYLWIEPVVQMIHQWPDRIQEFKTHVFPHCFLPNIEEYLHFLSYLHFDKHVETKGELPDALKCFENSTNILEDFEEFKILLATIQTGKELGIVKDVDYRQYNKIEVHGSFLHFPDLIFGDWMSHPEPEVRLAGLFLSVYSTAGTRPITRGVFKSLKRNLAHFHTETDANARREIMGYIQKLIDRLRGSTVTLAKGLAKASTGRLAYPKECFPDAISPPSRLAQDPLLEHLSFVPWYLSFLESELKPTASYQRRITALRAFSIVLRCGIDPRVPRQYLSKSAQGQIIWAHALKIPNSTTLRLLLDLVLDPFDDIREASVTLLKICLESLPEEERRAEISRFPRFIKRAETAMLRTGRADQADGVARAYGLLFSLNRDDALETNSSETEEPTRGEIALRLSDQLEETIEVARTNLSEAVDGRPVHGTFAAIRYILDQDQFYNDIAQLPMGKYLIWRQVHARILTAFETLWSIVQSVLCADAPEGHVPEDLEEEASLDTKEILSYSWRGLKEASTLLRAIISKAPVGTDERALIHPTMFEKLGRLCFVQLVELRHRGAHSAVAQTFGAFCRRCASAEDEILKVLPEKWYQETLLSIQDKAGAITRRSAGIPSLMAGIIAADSQSSGKLFPRAMRDLVAEASVDAKSANIEESRLPQVHALNCIKEIFTSSKLSVASETYIGEGLELAARTLNSRIWPIRNCSLMLFKALIERLLGSDEAQDWKEQERTKTSRFSYNNYPSLVGILVDLLDPEGPLKKSMAPTVENAIMDLHGAEGVFPALQILRQAAPPEAYRSKMIDSVRHLLGSPHWHLRDMAARTLVSLHRPEEYYETIVGLLPSTESSHNRRHGELLSVKYMLRKFLHHSQEIGMNSTSLDALIFALDEKSDGLYTSDPCPFTKSAFLEIVNLCGMAILQWKQSALSLAAWAQLMESLSIGPNHTLELSKRPGDDLLHNSIVQCFFIDRSISRYDFDDPDQPPVHSEIENALVWLESEYPDACCAALETLDSIIHLRAAASPAIPTVSILASIHHLILHGTDQEVLSNAQSVLGTSFASPTLRAEFFSQVNSSTLPKTLIHLESQCTSSAPSNARSALPLLAIFLDHASQVTPQGEDQTQLLRQSARYILLVRTALAEANPFDARFAAITSLSSLEHILALPLTPSRATADLVLGIAAVLYTALTDDDDEIRDLAARTTGRFLRAQGVESAKDTVPVLASQALVRWLASPAVSGSPAAPALAALSVRHVTGHTGALWQPPFEEEWLESRKEDTALFATERQNLYVDPASSVALFARLLCALPAERVPAPVRTGLAEYTVSALSTLGATAGAEMDGPLGWSAKAEVFTLCVRAVCAAEVVLGWGGEDAGRVRAALGAFLQAAGGSEVHGLVVKRAEGVLAKSVLGVLSRIGGGMEEMGWGFDGGEI